MKYESMWIVLSLLLPSGNGHIISGPKDTEAVVGTQLVLRCQTDIRDSANAVEFHFKADHYAPFVTIYKEGLILNGNKGKMNVTANVSSGQHDLVIFNVSLNNAGAYTCLDYDSAEKAEVIVFEQYPSEEFCSVVKPHRHTPRMNQCDMESDLIQMSCKLRFKGNLPPFMEWLNGERVISSNTSSADGVITSSIQLRAEELQSQTFSARITYENKMTSKFLWKKTVDIGSTSNISVVTNAECNQRQANCSAHANSSCSCVWIDGSNNTVSNESLLWLENMPKGNYTCIATCFMREMSCSFVAKQINYTCDREQVAEDIPLTIVLSLVAISITLVAVTTIILLRRRMAENKSNYLATEDPVDDKEVEALTQASQEFHSEKPMISSDYPHHHQMGGNDRSAFSLALPVSTNWETNDLSEHILHQEPRETIVESPQNFHGFKQRQ